MNEILIIPTISQAARDLTAQRIEEMDTRWRELDPAETESVKRLRVASRRLRSALSAFKSLYPQRKPVNHLRDSLRELTSALGSARDGVVLRQRLDDWAASKRTSAALEPLREQLKQQAEQSQAALAAALHHFNHDEMVRCARETLLEGLPADHVAATVRTDPHDVPVTLAILPQVRDRFDAGRTAHLAALETTNPLDMHQHRLAIKRLRYTLELFAAYLPPASLTIPILKKWQTQLGDLHDCDVLIELVSKEASDNPTLRAALTRLDKRRAAMLAEYLTSRQQLEAGQWGELANEWQAILDRQPAPTAAEIEQSAALPLTDWPHARQVQRLALRLFDQFDPTLFHERDRLILAAAALLHDAGMVGGPQGHNKLSYKLIRKARLPGLDKQERELVALVARYHRRALPRLQHKAYAALNLDEQTRVSRLAALLRIADGLDYEHDGSTSSITITSAADGTTIHAGGASESEIAQAEKKADLFTPAFGPAVRIAAVRANPPGA